MIESFSKAGNFKINKHVERSGHFIYYEGYLNKNG